ncbi:histidine phosphatase family protein [Desulforamulus aeronauticus]|uniref:Probable phosphoglycerate mutase n=1 Tax=Desulforamulus aeronauticus DSM 10349 TaxID=1121421 RepID=A0A1M6SGZ9_9FIRM|nr:histidine phosphatase family protein [Desulforamulus aeronauticus]SHK43985.1 probable phosphoglycerate mutase [Desulforamulus aeronauticus DSM 10349]
MVRNGECTLDDKKRFIGQLDLSLNENGIKQAKRLQQELTCVKLNHIFCSELQRSIETAKIIAEKQKTVPVVIENLKEVSLGEWEGQTFEQIIRKDAKRFKERGKDIANHRPPGGESFADLSQRVVKEYERILDETTGNILIAGHAGVNRVLLCHVLDMPLENLFRISQDYGCFNVIWQRNSGFRLHVYNRTYKILPF